MDITATPILANLGLALVHSIWQGFFAGLAVIAFRKLTKGQSPTLQYGFQIIMLFTCFAAFLVTFGLFQFSGNAVTEMIFIRGAEAAAGPALGTQSAINGSGVSLSGLQGWLSGNAHIFGLLWCIGFAVLAARYLINFSLTQQLRKTGLSAVPVKWDHRFRTLVLNAGLTKSIGFYVSSRVNNPMTLGFFKPIVLVPASFFTGLPSAQIEAVLLHEIAHIRRHDYLVNLAQTAIKTVFFFHPAIHFISRKIDEDREHACDDYSVNYTQDPHSLAKALAALRLSHSGQSFAMAAAGKNAPLMTRLKRLTLNPETTKPQGNLMIPALTVLMAGLIYFSAAPMTDAHPTNEADEYDHPEPRKGNYSFETVVKDGKSITAKIGEDGRRWVRTENGWFDLDNDPRAKKAISNSQSHMKYPPVPPTPPAPPNFTKSSKWDHKNFEKKMAQFEIDMEYFEADMERFAEDMVENYAVDIDEDKITRQVERAMERAEDERERAMDRAEEARERAEDEAERAMERSEDARERAMERAEEARERTEEKRERAEERAERARERAKKHHKHEAKMHNKYGELRSTLYGYLLEDKLVSSANDPVIIRWENKHWTANGVRVPSQTEDKYCELFSKHRVHKNADTVMKFKSEYISISSQSEDGNSQHRVTVGTWNHDDNDKTDHNKDHSSREGMHQGKNGKWHKDHASLETQPSFSFIHPAQPTRVTMTYGDTDIASDKFHKGLDFAGKPNSHIVASAPGKVVKAGLDGDWGKVVEIEHEGGYKTVYAHMNGVCVKPNDVVDAGQQVGLLGSTGKSTKPHLHFEIQKDGKTLNPETLIVGS